MKKIATLLALFALIIISVSAHTDRVVRATQGYKAPAIELNDTSSITFNGKWTLVNFWTSSDPTSRIAAGNYDLAARSMGDSADFALMSINIDSSEALYNQILVADGLTAGTQIHLDAEALARVADDYYLDRGCNSYLIDPSGRIAAVNPAPEQLRDLASI